MTTCFFVNLQCNYGQFLKSLHYETPISRFSADCSRLLIAPFLKAQSHADKILKDEIISDLKENILSFWEKYSVDLPEVFTVHWDVTVPR